MSRRWSPYHCHTMREVGDNSVRINRQLKPGTRPPHLAIKERTKQLGVVHTTTNRTCVAEQDTQERPMDRDDIPSHAAMTTYLDVTNLATPGPKTANGLHWRYVVLWPNIEAPHTLFAS